MKRSNDNVKCEVRRIWLLFFFFGCDSLFFNILGEEKQDLDEQGRDSSAKNTTKQFQIKN